MLVLGRKEGERILLRNHRTGERIVVTQLGIKVKRPYSRIGIDAPDDWEIVREELMRGEPCQQP